MKLIDEKTIELGANEWASGHGNQKDAIMFDFKAGVFFAEEQITPKMVEFADFCQSVERNKLTGLYWYNLKHLTTQQLLEEFLKQSENERNTREN